MGVCVYIYIYALIRDYKLSYRDMLAYINLDIWDHIGTLKI